MAPPPATRNNPQSQPLTTLLRLICESYPPNTCLRELLQNADDAGATEIEYILDTNTYDAKPLLHEALAEYQGPALLARNNSVFTDEDLASLSAVGDSRKRHDAESTGKFGQGFNSVYHFTDGPWVYSRSLLLMLDPHKTWSRNFSPDDPGGPMWDVVEERNCPEVQNHLNTFGAFDLNYTRSNNETIIRIPLRTQEQAKTSKIFQQEISIQNIKDALEDFGQEIQEGGLLFLKHIRKIVIKLNRDIVLSAQILSDDLTSASMRMAIPTDFKERYAPNMPPTTHDLSKTFEMRIEFSTKQYPNPRLFRYIVQHTMVRSSGDRNLDIWARERKLYPWVAIAAPLKDDCTDDLFYGRLFSTLRLPVRTNQPVHIHGLFSITPDRGRLSSSGQSPGYEDLATKWNSFMFAKCVSTAWASLLAHRSDVSWHEEKFALWPRAEFAHSELWDKLDDGVIDIVINLNLTVWNASNGCCVDIDHGFFAANDAEAKKYGPAFAAALLPAVYLEDSLLKKLEHRMKVLDRNVTILTPVTVRQFFRQHGLPALSSEIRSVLLEFLLLDAIKSPLEKEQRGRLYNDLHGIQIWPTVSGNLSSSDHADLMLPRDDAEMQLFSNSRATKTLDISKLSSTVRKLLLNDIEHLAMVMRFRYLEDLALDWPVMYLMVPRPENSRGWVKRAFGLDSVLYEIWAWITERVQEGQRIDLELSRDLWLVPMNDFRIRKYAPKSLKTPLLVIEKEDLLFEFLVAITEQGPLEMPPLLDTDLLPKEARELLRKKGPIKTDTQCTCIHDSETFVNWLAAGKDTLAKASDDEKMMLLNHLETLTRDSAFPTGLSPTLISQMRSLPIYSKISCSPPFEKRGYTKCALTASGRTYWTPKNPSDFPPVPDIAGVSFYNPQYEIEGLMMRRLRALQDATNKDLLTLHLLPWMESIPSDAESQLKIPKANLIDWIMRGSRRPSKTWLTEVISHPIIPLPLQDGKRQYRPLAGMVDPSSELAKLYEEKENVFPCPEFFSRHKDALIACGIATKPTWSTPIERAKYFSWCLVESETLQRKVDCLLKLPIEKELISSTREVADIRKLKWLPGVSLNGEFALLAPTESRGADQSHLVDLLWGTAKIVVKANWRKLLGWDQSIPTEILLAQLDLCLAAKDYDKASKVLREIEPEDYSSLALKPCFLGRSGGYFTSDKVFLPGSRLQSRPLAPYLDELDAKFAKDHDKLVTGLGLRSQPSVQDLQDVQNALEETVDGRLSAFNLGIAISTLEIATRLEYDTQDLRIPDATMTLRELKEIVHGDPLSTGDIASFNFTHPEISNDLARRLDVENSLKRAIRLKIDFNSEDENDYTPKEKLKTVISDTLERYPINSTFNEFLANADDARAKNITWLLDECRERSYGSSSLLTTDLKPFQGSALFVCNDAVFSKKDFAGFKDIGQGGKKDDIHSTGMFGRGALSMYHFTDVPMLVSDDSFLVLDPQQRVLPVNFNRRRERKVGTKISLSAVNRLAPDQLGPFLGLYNFVRDLDHYKGTIFRFPLRAIGAKTLLKDHVQHIDPVGIRSLLGEYLAVARTALLFLRSVESIEFRIRGQEDPQWSVSARRSQRQDSETCQDVEITSIQGGKLQQVDRWCVGRRNITQIPPNIKRFGRGSEKSAECGIATCLASQKTDAEGDTVMAGQPSDVVSSTIQTVEHKVFCRLPTGHTSSLPVSFHASFAVTGDRRSIALEDSAENSAWNKWLLTTPLTNLYLEVLQLLTTSVGEKAFDFWPSMVSYRSSPMLSETLCRAFWNSLLTRGQNLNSLFPVVIQDCTSESRDGPPGNDVSKAAISLAQARFDFLPDKVSLALRPLLVELCPNLVRLSRKLWPDYKRTAVEVAGSSKQIDADYLCQMFFNDDNCKALEAFIRRLEHEDDKRAAMAMLLKTMVPKISGDEMTPLEILGGCRVLPRPNLDAPLGLLLWNVSPGSTYHYVATTEEQKLFAFASDSMVNTELSQDTGDLIGNLLKAPFNVRKLDFTDLGDLLAQPRSPTNLSIAVDNRDGWMLEFWHYVNPKLRILVNARRWSGPFAEVYLNTLLTEGGLRDRAVYRFKCNNQWCYLTPCEFEAQPCVVEPLDDHQRKFCEQIPGLRAIDRECVPFLLSESEGDLNRAGSFRRLVQAFEKIERSTQTPTKTFVGKILNSDSKELLHSMLLNHLRVGEASNINLLRSLPVWQRLRTLDSGLSTEHIAAEDAKFCGHSEMLLPWVGNLGSFVNPKLVSSSGRALFKLNITPLTAQQTWNTINADLPTNVKEEVSRKHYLRMIQYLAANDVKIRGEKVAPNGASVLCEVHSLYDHQDNIFKAAFREQEKTRFLHVDFRGTSSKSFWLSAGLRARPPTGAMKSEHFLECALAINRRWDPASTSQSFEEDAGIVAAYLQFDQPEFRNWSNWAQISRMQMFRVRSVSPNENGYRQTRMHRGKTHCALEEASSLDHIRIVWSQTNFLQDPPCLYVFQRLPRGGIPSAEKVYQHLLILMAIIQDVTQYDLAEYLRDVQACYEHLQKELDATKFIPGVHHARIWLNLDTTQVDLISKDNVQGPTSARLLCLNCPVDPLPIKTARKFLVPYEKLLMGLGCKSVKQPTSAVPAPSADTRELSLAAAMAEMRDLRDQHQLTDVILEAEGIQHPAHKIVLAAVSKYCKAQFAGEWGRLLQHQATIHLEDLRATTLSQMIDFAYTGDFHWPQLQDPEDNTEIADRLDELLDLLDGTNMWMLDRLHGMTQDFLTSQSWSAIYIRVDNVNEIKERAQGARAGRLVKHCEDFELANSDFVEAFRNEGSEVGDGMQLD